MAKNYADKNGRIISDKDFEKLLKEKTQEWIKDEVWFEDWLNMNNYYISNVFFLSEEDKKEIWEKFEKESSNEARWELLEVYGWAPCE